VPVRAGVEPTGVDGKNHAGRDEDMADRNDPRRPSGDAHAFADRIAQQEESDHDHLRGRLGFAGGVGGEHGAVRERELTQSGDEKITRDEDDGGPRRDVVRPSEQNERGGDENFVGQRIHQAAEVGLALHATGDDAVEVVGKNGQREGDGCDRRAPRHAAFPRRDEENRQKKADDGELIREGHGGKAAKVAKGPWLGQ
jgi:hypothetical protein